MNRPTSSLLCLLTGVCLMLLQAPMSQAKVSVSLAAGLNACVEDEPGDCSRTDNSGVGGLGVFYQVLPKLDVGIDLRFGALSPHSDPSNTDQAISTFHMMPTAIWLEPIADRYHVEGRLGFGYASRTHSYKSVTGSDTARNWVSWSAISLGAAFSMEVWEALEAGMGLDLYLQDGGTMCTKTTGSSCVDHEDGMHELLNAYLFARYRL